MTKQAQKTLFLLFLDFLRGTATTVFRRKHSPCNSDKKDSQKPFYTKDSGYLLFLMKKSLTKISIFSLTA